MAVIVVYDACVLHPAPLRDLLLRIARTGVVRARWSERILVRSVAKFRALRAGDRPTDEAPSTPE